MLHPRHIRNDHNGWVNMSKTIVTETNTGESFGSVGYRSYVLLTLTAIYLFNFLDRILISVLSRPIIEEFSLTNFQFGILTGIGFALFYTALGIPIARLSERVSRVKIIGVCVYFGLSQRLFVDWLWVSGRYSLHDWQSAWAKRDAHRQQTH